MQTILNSVLTFQFKEVFTSFQDFKSKVIPLFVAYDDTILEKMYLLLSRYYNNQWIRYRTTQEFIEDFSMKFEDVYSKYKIIIEQIIITYALSREELLIDSKRYSTIIKEYLDNSNRSTATTPTFIEPSSQYDDNYSDIKARGSTSGSSNDTHNDIIHKSPVAEMEELKRLSNLCLNRFCNEFNPLFIQMVDSELIDCYEYIKELEG